MTTASALASSSKRPLPSSSTPAAKRSRPAPAPPAPSTFDDSDDEDEGLDDSARAKSERKAARVIRNRESAQRSRNQRKAHLVYLEQRVRELEEENRSLKDSSTRAGSPVSVSLPLFSGINLAAVAPPPADVEVPRVDVSALQSENVALRERVGLLENLVKQVVALSTFNATPAPVVEAASVPPAPTPIDSTPIDWDALFTTQLAAPEPLAPAPAAADSIDLTNTLARHPAAGEDFGDRFEFTADQSADTSSGASSGLDGAITGFDAPPAYDPHMWQGGKQEIEAGLEETWDAGMKDLLDRLEAAEGSEAAVEQVVAPWEWNWGVTV